MGHRLAARLRNLEHTANAGEPVRIRVVWRAMTDEELAEARARGEVIITFGDKQRGDWSNCTTDKSAQNNLFGRLDHEQHERDAGPA